MEHGAWSRHRAIDPKVGSQPGDQLAPGAWQPGGQYQQ
jgi:hypothetical protein